MTETPQSVQLTQLRDYQFNIDFGAGLPALQADEPPPLGQGAGPTPVQLLCASVGNCLSASLLFACGKYKQDPGGLRCQVQAEVGRNADGRLRVLSMQARLDMGRPGNTLEHLDRILGGFEAFCTVTQSVQTSVPVSVSVWDSEGAQLK